MLSLFFLKKFVHIPVLGRRFFLPSVVKNENGEKESTTLREYIQRNNNVKVGLYSYGSCFAEDFNVGGKVEIGRYCSFASNIHYYGANHPVEYASCSPYFYNKSFGYQVRDVKREELQIGNDVWIGANVIITKNCCNIGNGAIIGAGSIVTKDIPEYAIVVGNPARVIRYRFDEETIALLEKSKWWEVSPDRLMEFYDVIDNPRLFAEKVSQKTNQ